MRIRPRPPADRPGSAGDAVGGAAGGPAAETGDDARARTEMFWALVLRRFYDHVHRGGQEDNDDDSTR